VGGIDMKIEKLEIRSFRCFKDIKFPLGDQVTVIAGHNATGKSTILGMLGHCGEITSKLRPLLKPSFKAELSDIIKFSQDYDEIISDIGTIHFREFPPNDPINYPSKLNYRSTWQNKKTRYRILPKQTATRKTVKKILWPTLYLGLSRLYPVGESAEVENQNLKISKNEKQYLIENYKSILTMLWEDLNDFQSISISETSKKKSIGIITNKYDHLCNSAGQDNLGQILMAVLSFKRLKELQQTQWQGGLLLIDELDATLHPCAQNKLIDYLYREAKSIGIQIVVTTHSLSLLEYICTKVDHNQQSNINNYELIYLSNANRSIKCSINPQFDSIYSDMTTQYHLENSIRRKIPIYSEDAEARWFLQILLEQYMHRVKLLDIKMGYLQLLNLLKEDYGYFGKCIFVFDGDVDATILSKVAKNFNIPEMPNILKIPGDKSPEEVLWNYVSTLPEEHPFYLGSDKLIFSLRNIAENGPFSDRYSSYIENRDKFKHWFNDNPQLVKKIFDYWFVDNQPLVTEFIHKFIEVFNKVADLNYVSKIVLEKVE
jgi:AAA15 family ATPase/GTPase